MVKRIKQEEAQELAVKLLGPKALAVKLGQNKYAIQTRVHRWLRLFGKSEGKTIATGTSYAEVLKKVAAQHSSTLDLLRTGHTNLSETLELISNTTTSNTNQQ